MARPSEFSVIIPTSGRRPLDRTLAALGRLNSPAAEVIVVQDGGAPGTHVPDCRVPVRVVRQQRSGAAAARNSGAREARTAFLVFLDDDCVPRPEWLDAIAAATTPQTAAAGVVRNGLCENLFAAASHIVVDEFTRAQRLPAPGQYDFLPTANLAVQAEAFRSVGGFDERFPGAAGEDRDFCYRWRSRAFSLRTVPSAIVDHFHEMDLSEFLRQHHRYGRGARLFYSLHRNAAPTGLHFYRAIATTVLAQRGWTRATSLAILIALSQASAAVGYMSSSGAAARQ